MKALLAAAAIGGLSAQAADGFDWPQWRGPDRSGISQERDWSSLGAEDPLWTKDLGFGHSSFAIVGDRVYTLGHDVEAGLDRVFCLDATTGAEHWQHSYPSDLWDNAHDGGTLTTPTVTDGVVYTSNREGNVFCLDAMTGTVVWARDLESEMGLEPPTWGFSASPLIVDDRVILNVDRVVALDRRTGATAWATERQYGIAYATPAAFEHDGRDCLASLSGDGLVVLDRADGSELAFFEWVKNPQIYPATPVVIGDRIFISAGYDRGCAMLRFTGDALEPIWESRVMRTKMSGSILWQDHLIGFDESILKCIDLDGNEKWRKRGLGTGSLSMAGDRLLILDGKGQIIVAQASTEEYVELSRRDIFDDGTSWSTPVVSHGLVYCRTSTGRMACLDHRGAATVAAAGPGTGAGEPADAVLPDAATLVARHVAGVGGPDAIDRVQSVRMTGPGESLRNTVRKGAVTLVWDRERGFHWSDEFSFNFGHDREAGWILGPRVEARVLQGSELDGIREAGSFARLLDPASYYASFGAVSATVFDNRPCYAVAAMTPTGRKCTVYFDRATGFLAGQESEGIHLWTFADYRPCGDVQLPMRWSIFEPAKGEMDLATFEKVERDGAIGDEAFAAPAFIRLLLRTPEEVAADDARLAREHASMLGRWIGTQPEEGEEPEQAHFMVQDGFLAIEWDDDSVDRLHPVNDQGRFALVGFEFYTFEPELGEGGEVTAITVRIGGNPIDRMIRHEPSSTGG